MVSEPHTQVLGWSSTYLPLIMLQWKMRPQQKNPVKGKRRPVFGRTSGFFRSHFPDKKKIQLFAVPGVFSLTIFRFCDASPEKLTWNLAPQNLEVWGAMNFPVVFGPWFFFRSETAPHRTIPKHQISTQHKPRRSMPHAVTRYCSGWKRTTCSYTKKKTTT